LTKTPVRTLAELIEWNERHADAMPVYAQDKLIRSCGLDADGLADGRVDALRAHCRAVGASVEATMERHGVDIILGPGDCFLTSHASVNGCPIVALPLACRLDNGRPVGLQALARRHHERRLLAFAAAFERSFSPRPVPDMHDQSMRA
jgi:amidase